jgi:glycosyltransferase involved in cell wall biosynthesis
MREPRVVFVNRYFFPDHSATSQLLSDLAFHLAAQGIEVTVVTSAQVYDDPAARLSAREVVRGVEVRRVWTTRCGRGRLTGRALDYFTFYLGAVWILLRLLRHGDTVVAKTDPPLLSIVAAVAARARGARLVNWVQDLFPEIATALGVRALRPLEAPLRALRNWSFGIARHNVAIGALMAQRLMEQGIEPGRVAVIHNWCSAPGLRPLPAEEIGLRRSWGLAGRFVVGYSGNMGRAHDFETVLAAARLLRTAPAVVLLLIGAGAQRAWLEEAVARGALANIVFQPYQPLALLKESLCVPDVHLTSLQPELEGCIVPSKFYGIAAAGRPVIHIGRRDGEIGRLIAEAGCGFAVEPGDAAHLVAIVRRLAADPAYCHALGTRARRAYELRFDRALALERWLQMLAPVRTSRPEPGLAAARLPEGDIS